MLNFQRIGPRMVCLQIILDTWEVLGLFTLANGVQQAEFIARNEKILLHI